MLIPLPGSDPSQTIFGGVPKRMGDKHRKKFKIQKLGNGVFFIGICLVYLWNK